MWEIEGNAALPMPHSAGESENTFLGARGPATPLICSLSTHSAWLLLGCQVGLTDTVIGRVGLGMSIQLGPASYCVPAGSGEWEKAVSYLRTLQSSPGGAWALC